MFLITTNFSGLLTDLILVIETVSSTEVVPSRFLTVEYCLPKTELKLCLHLRLYPLRIAVVSSTEVVSSYYLINANYVL